MEFVCRISAKDYREALRLKQRTLRRIIFALFVLDAVLWFWWMILAAQGNIRTASHVLAQAVAVLVWPTLMAIFLPLNAWYGYRKNRNIRSEFRYQLSRDEVSYRSSTGGSGTAPWTSLNYWQESKGVFILVSPSNVFLICPKQCMSNEEQEEFRTILTSELQKK